MKYFIRLFFVIISIGCYAQTPPAVLIVPMNNNMITIDNQVAKMLKYNKTSTDSVKKNIQNVTINRLLAQFPDYSFINLQNSNFPFLIDSLDVLCQWNSFQFKKITDSKGLERINLVNNQNPQLKYYGRVISDKYLENFRTLIQKYNLKYIFFINKFETFTRRPFEATTYLCLHFEIYDNSLNKVFGSKSYYPVKITKTMYSRVFDYFVSNAINDFYGGIKEFLSQK